MDKDRMVEVYQPPKMWLPPTAKREGGSQFDDELETAESKEAEVAKGMAEMLGHLQARPDHKIYVSSTGDREKMRAVCNWWFRDGYLKFHPDIKIEYGVPEGSIRIAE